MKIKACVELKSAFDSMKGNVSVKDKERGEQGKVLERMFYSLVTERKSCSFS